MKHWLSVLTIAGGLLLPAILTADETEDYDAIQQLLKDKKLDEAATALTKALEANPDSKKLSRLYITLYSSASRAGNMKLAADSLGSFLNQELKSADDPNTARTISSYASMYLSLAQRAGMAEAGEEMLDRIIAKLESLEANSEILDALLTVQTRKAVALRSADKVDEAVSLIEKAAERIQKLYEADSESIDLALLNAKGMQQLLYILPRTDEERRTKLENEHQTFIEKLLAKHPEDSKVVVAYVSSRISSISGMVRSDTLQAEKQLNDLKAYLDGIKTEDEKILRPLASYQRTIASLTRSIDVAKKHVELIGEPAFAIDPAVETWVNGEAMTDSALKGKVVLLDFWAVWCGPCIATFPHLREWNEKYADKGLVIVGVTRYYNYAWDDEAGRATRSKEDVAPEDENAMLVKFAEHHELHHRFLVTNKESQLNQQYGVTGIPQAVLIGRDGTIRMIRVGSGSQNAEELDAMLEKLINESPAAAGG